MKDVKVLIGNYGSGKSELALNFAMQAAARGDRTELLDLDMVNTYFRLTERGKMVEQKEIRLVSPNFACSGIETLSLPAEVSSAFVLDWDTVIFELHHLPQQLIAVPQIVRTGHGGQVGIVDHTGDLHGKKDILDAFLARDPDPKYVGKPVAIDVYMHRDWDSYIEYGLNTKNPHKDMY